MQHWTTAFAQQLKYGKKEPNKILKDIFGRHNGTAMRMNVKENMRIRQIIRMGVKYKLVFKHCIMVGIAEQQHNSITLKPYEAK